MVIQDLRLSANGSGWAVPAAVLALGTAVCAVAEAAILDLFLGRPLVGGGSITTLLPGFVYASATVMKVSLIASAVLWAATGITRIIEPRRAGPSRTGAPKWALASLALPPASLLLGSMAVLATPCWSQASGVRLAARFPLAARTAVFVMLGTILAGLAASAVSLVRRERPAIPALVGLAANLALIGLFWHLRFHSHGFDQDRWAP